MGNELKATRTKGKLKPTTTNVVKSSMKEGSTEGMKNVVKSSIPFKLRNGVGKMDSYSAMQKKGLISPMQVEGDGDKIKKSTKSSKDPETGLITVTTRETSSGGDITPEARDWITNNPKAYKKLLEEKREKESMKSMTQVPTKPAIKIETEANPRDIKKVNQPPLSPEPEKKKVKRSTSNPKKRKPTKYKKKIRKPEFCTKFSNKC